MDAITFVPSLPMGMALGRKVAKQNQSKEIILKNKYHQAMEKTVSNTMASPASQQIAKPAEAKFTKIKKLFDLEYLNYNRETHRFARVSARKLRVNEIVSNNTRLTRNDIEKNNEFTVIEGIKEVKKIEMPQKPIVNETSMNNTFNNTETPRIEKPLTQSPINNNFEDYNNGRSSLSRVSRLNSNDLYNSNPVNDEVAKQVDLNINKSSEKVMEKYNSLMHSGDNPDLIDIDLAREESKVDQIKRENDEKRRLVIEAKARIEQLEKAHKLKEVKEELLEQTTEYNSLTQELAALQEREEELRSSIRI